MNDINQLPRLCDIQNGRYSLWILVAKVLDNGCYGVASECWGDSELAACCPETNEPTSCFYDTSILRIPLISFNGSLWDVLLRCSKWLLGAWLDSFTMILRCWLVVWVKWGRPLVSMTLWSRVMFNWKAVFKSMGQLGTLLPPRGASFTPLCGMFLQSPSASSNVANFTFLRNPLSELWVCEFWLLRCSTMVARARPVCVEVIQNWLLAAPSQTSPPSCFYDTSILRYPFDLFQWKSMGRVAKVL